MLGKISELSYILTLIINKELPLKIKIAVISFVFYSIGCTTIRPAVHIAESLKPRNPTAAGSVLKSWDGCYQSMESGMRFLSFCIWGDSARSNGSGVKLIVFNPDSNQIRACASSSDSGSENGGDFYLEVKGSRLLVLRNVIIENEVASFGDVQLEKNYLKFFHMSESGVQVRQSAYSKSAECLTLKAGEYKSFSTL